MNDRFNLNELTPMNFKNSKMYLKQLNKIGSGSSRDVYEYGDHALKVARNTKGISQNFEEFVLMVNEDLIKLKITPPIIEVGVHKTKVKWVLMGRAKPISEETLNSYFGISITQAITICDECDTYKEVLASDRKLKDGPLLKNLFQLIKQFPVIMSGDLGVIENWGMYKRRPVLVDLGFTINNEYMY